MCVTAHALLSAIASRIEAGGADATRAELDAVIAAGCPRGDVERTLAERRDRAGAEAVRSAFVRALDALGRPDG